MRHETDWFPTVGDHPHGFVVWNHCSSRTLTSRWISCHLGNFNYKPSLHGRKPKETLIEPEIQECMVLVPTAFLPHELDMWSIDIDIIIKLCYQRIGLELRLKTHVQREIANESPRVLPDFSLLAYHQSEIPHTTTGAALQIARCTIWCDEPQEPSRPSRFASDQGKQFRPCSEHVKWLWYLLHV